MRVVQKASGPGHLAVCFLIGNYLDEKLREALPGVAIVATDQAPLQPTYGEISSARLDAGNPTGGLILIGYSAGCQPVRHLLLSGIHAIGVVTIDGTHAGMPPAENQISVWRDLASAARNGDVCWIATCTQMTYVERIPVGQRGRAMATRHVLEQALAVTLTPGIGIHDRGLHVLSYESPQEPTAEAAQAHRDQANKVLPELLRKYLAPWLAEHGATVAPTDPPPTMQSTKDPQWRDRSVPLGVRCILWSEAEMAAGVVETPPGSNRHPRIDEYLNPTGAPRSTLPPLPREPIYRRRTGEPLGLKGVPWCSAAAGAAHRACRLDGEATPTVRLAGFEMVEDAREEGTWIDIAEVRSGAADFDEGDIGIASRDDPKKRGDEWQRHVFRVRKKHGGGKYQGIGGNEGGAWRATERSIWDADVLGFIKVGRS